MDVLFFLGKYLDFLVQCTYIIIWLNFDLFFVVEGFSGRMVKVLKTYCYDLFLFNTFYQVPDYSCFCYIFVYILLLSRRF